MKKQKACQPYNRPALKSSFPLQNQTHFKNLENEGKW